MTKSRSFYVLYPANNRLRNLLNAMKLFADENQRTEAHLTVRGPYYKKIAKKVVERYSEIISGNILLVNSVSNFFDFDQNTVFFSCAETEELKAVWKKVGYKDFNPHITIYDGKDREFATELYNVLKEHFKPFICKVTPLLWLEPKSNDTLKLYYLKTISEYDEILKDILEISKKEINFKTITTEMRLSKIDAIARQLYNEYFE